MPGGRVANLQRPFRVVYIDYRDIDWGDPSRTVRAAVDAGYNVVMLAFFLANGPADMCIAWQGLSDQVKQQTIDYAHQRNSVIMASVGGSTDTPYTGSANAYATKAASWALGNRLDGVDFDLENFNTGLTYGSMSGPQVIAWLAEASNSARRVLGSAHFISHAPQAPYFGAIGSANPNPWTQQWGGYSAVYKAAPTIDFFSVQYYNQGGSCYTSYRGLFRESRSDCGVFPGTSVQELTNYGIPMDKIVVGKYLLQGDASNGYVSAPDLHNMVAQAGNELRWNAGVMCWAWKNADSQRWIKTIYP